MFKTASQLLKLIIFSLIIISLWSFFLFPAQALVMPAVYVEDLKIDQRDFQAGKQISGSFVVWNAEEMAINDITYKFLLFLKDETGIPGVYIDEKVSQVRFNLPSGEKRTFSFSYNIPQTSRAIDTLSGLAFGFPVFLWVGRKEK